MSHGATANILIRRFRRELCCTIAMLAMTSPAYAADAAAAATAPADTAQEEIIVTGTQISRAGFVSPTPVTSITQGDIEKVGSINIADALNQIPALKSSVTPSSLGTLSMLPGCN